MAKKIDATNIPNPKSPEKKPTENKFTFMNIFKKNNEVDDPESQPNSSLDFPS